MERWLPALRAACSCVRLPQTAAAPSFDAPRDLTARAIHRFPQEIRPWRNAGCAEEPPRHFLDLDRSGAYPFADLPREVDEAVATFGREQAITSGTAPWRTAETWTSS